MTNWPTGNSSGLLGLLMQNLKVKRKVFVSYHHGGDQLWYEEFSRTFAAQYDVFHDHSLQRRIDSNDTGYVDRTIRENNIAGTSITVVLLGAETPKRKYVDWEIYATLHHEHGLLGLVLPTAQRALTGSVIVPARFHHNMQGGYAHMIDWTYDPAVLKMAMELAIARSSFTSLIDNRAGKFSRNLP